jgi:putative membrane protein
MSRIPFSKSVVSIALVSTGFALGACAQAQSPSQPQSQDAMSFSTGTASIAGGALAAKDRRFIEKAARSGMAEVEMGKLAQDKAASNQVKAFARKMAEDHSKANDELKQLAAAKGVTLPTDIPAKDRREINKLSKLSGADFDREYMKSMVSDHQKDVSEFKSESKSSRDNDVKNFAAKTLPTLQQHLGLAESTKASAKN